MFTLWLGCSSEDVRREAEQIVNAPQPQSAEPSNMFDLRPASDFAYRQGEIVISDSGVYVVYEVRFSDPFAVTRQWQCPACGRNVTIQRGFRPRFRKTLLVSLALAAAAWAVYWAFFESPQAMFAWMVAHVPATVADTIPEVTSVLVFLLAAAVDLARQWAASRERGFFRCRDQQHRVVGHGEEVPGEVRASWYYRNL